MTFALKDHSRERPAPGLNGGGNPLAADGCRSLPQTPIRGQARHDVQAGSMPLHDSVLATTSGSDTSRWVDVATCVTSSL